MGTENPAEELLDEAIEATFPASDPVAVDDAWAAEQQRERRHKAKQGQAAPEREPERDQ